MLLFLKQTGSAVAKTEVLAMRFHEV